MDKHNKHHKNKAKDSDKPQPSQPTLAAPQEQIAGKIDQATVTGQKSKLAKGKQR